MTATAAAAAVPTATELILHCSDGIQMAAQSWSIAPGGGDNDNNNCSHNEKDPSKVHRILCLHGWMDNCRSFHHFAPSLLSKLQLPESAVELVALDFPGHGWSSHKSVDGPPVLLAESAFYVAEAVQQLQWAATTTTTDSTTGTAVAVPLPFTLIGHSMGAAISCLYAAAFPEQVQKLVLLEGGTYDTFVMFAPNILF